jgi:hypothetical protein
MSHCLILESQMKASYNLYMKYAIVLSSDLSKGSLADSLSHSVLHVFMPFCYCLFMKMELVVVLEVREHGSLCPSVGREVTEHICMLPHY